MVLPHWEGKEGCEKRLSVNLPDYHAIGKYMKTLYLECVFLFPSIITTRIRAMALTLLFWRSLWVQSRQEVWNHLMVVGHFYPIENIPDKVTMEAKFFI